MAIRVTRAVTKNGRYYKAGEILDSPSGFEVSLGRIWGWETVTAPAPAKRMTKPELVQAAEVRGLDPDGLTKNEIIDLLEE